MAPGADEKYAQRGRSLTALYLTAYNQPARDDEIALEYFHVSGQIMEGTPVERLSFHKIDRAGFLRNLRETS